MMIKRISIKYILVFLFLLILFYLSFNRNKSQNYLDIRKSNRIYNEIAMDSLEILIQKLKGIYLGKLILQNKNGNQLFSQIIKNNSFIIIFYQSDFVCKPCLDKFSFSWEKFHKKISSSIGLKLIILSNEYKRATHIYCNKNNLKGSYFVDLQHYFINVFIRKNIPLI